MKVSAIANANIALAKYWGKRDANLILPCNSSLSVALSDLIAHTTVMPDKKDSFNLNGEEQNPASKAYQEYIASFLAKARRVYSVPPLRIISQNNFPTAAGLASSAAGFAALAVAINTACKLSLDTKELSILSRFGSGSATRSILGGFNIWQKGEKIDGSDSHIVNVAKQDFWPEFRIIACITDTSKKAFASRAGMAQTIKTCPIYESAWLSTADQDVDTIQKAILDKDFSLLGKTAEQNALKMHATMLSTTPPINYWNEATKEITSNIVEWRESGLESYFTMDAGPQVKIICLEENLSLLEQKLSALNYIERLYITSVGSAARITEEHLS